METGYQGHASVILLMLPGLGRVVAVSQCYARNGLFSCYSEYKIRIRYSAGTSIMKPMEKRWMRYSVNAAIKWEKRGGQLLLVVRFPMTLFLPYAQCIGIPNASGSSGSFRRISFPFDDEAERISRRKLKATRPLGGLRQISRSGSEKRFQSMLNWPVSLVFSPPS